MTIKLIVTDIDGTIMPYGKKTVTERTCRAFHAAMDAGILVGPASGRFYQWIPDFFHGDTACCQTALATNGMQIYLGGEKILQREVPAGACVAAAEVLAQVPHSGLLCFRDSKAYLVAGSRDDLAVAFPRYAQECVDGELPEGPVEKANVFIAGTLEETRALVARLNAEVAGVDFDVPQPMFSNVVPAGWNKGAALRWLMDREGIAPEEVVAFGDGGNDLQMLAVAGHSVAVEGALPEVKRAARHCIGPVEQDSVAACIEAIAAGDWPFDD